MPRRAAAVALESGRLDGFVSRCLARGYERLARPERTLALPRGARVVGIGGATLGGSGKTPMTLALARAAANAGCDVAVVCSGYPSYAGSPKVIDGEATAAAVGDEAAWLARDLARDVSVVVGRDRERALQVAAQRAELIVVDGLLQTRPERLALSLLMLETDRPFGAGRCPPAGDLRAAPERLLAACDAVLMPDPVAAPDASWARRAANPPVWRYSTELLGARRPDGTLVTPLELSRLPLGVALAVARPERVLAALSLAGVHPRARCLAADHARPRPAPAAVAAWLVTAKCATKLGTRLAGAPVWVLERQFFPPPQLLARLGISARETAARSVVCSAPCSPRASF